MCTYRDGCSVPADFDRLPRDPFSLLRTASGVKSQGLLVNCSWPSSGHEFKRAGANFMEEDPLFFTYPTFVTQPLEMEVI